jgi:hypothetical protein
MAVSRARHASSKSAVPTLQAEQAALDGFSRDERPYLPVPQSGVMAMWDLFSASRKG